MPHLQQAIHVRPGLFKLIDQLYAVQDILPSVQMSWDLSTIHPETNAWSNPELASKVIFARC